MKVNNFFLYRYGFFVWILIFTRCSTFQSFPNRHSREVERKIGFTPSENWLFIGDSHSVGGFGNGLREALIQGKVIREDQFFQFSVSGSSATHWLRRDQLSKLMIDFAYKIPGQLKVHQKGKISESFKSYVDLCDEIRPKTVVFELGTNDFYNFLKNKEKKSLEESVSDFQKLLTANLNSYCIVILPTFIKKTSIPKKYYSNFFEKIAFLSAQRGCLTVSSENIKMPSSLKMSSSDENLTWENCIHPPFSNGELLPNQPDGIHFSPDLGRYWGKCVAAKIIEKLRIPSL